MSSPIFDVINYHPLTNYWERFSIAEANGLEKIRPVFDHTFKEAKQNYKYLTELVMVLNHKIWEHRENIKNPELCAIYSKLFNKAYNYAMNHLEGKELSYFLEVTD